MKGNNTKKQFIELRAKGVSFSKIAKRLEVSKTTLIEWGKEFESEIINLKAMELEELQEMFYVQKQKRIELFGSQLSLILKELEKRDFTSIPTDKLIELKMKYLDFLKKEEMDMTLKVVEQKDLSELFHELDKSVKYLKV
jgi:transposase